MGIFDTYNRSDVNLVHLTVSPSINSWADTWCSGKHAFVEEFIEGETVTCTRFTSPLLSVSNIPIVKIIYVYDAPYGTVLLLECNNSIYLGQKISD